MWKWIPTEPLRQYGAMHTKDHWRSIARQLRDRNRPHRATRDTAIRSGVAQLLARLIEVDEVVVLYDPMPGEVNLWPLTDEADEVRFALTRTPDRGYQLSLHPATSALEPHRLGYRQPVAHSTVIADDDVRAVLVPALAFDREGNRLGFGAGYYDRLLARLPDCYKIGIADVVIDGVLPHEDFDVPMTHLATTSGVVEVEPIR
ncbi:MAG: 5-formyltetrahydrofolate cyclo-ligase [Acidimicrobiales bacterium]|nr:5-formyltetrahydrofolate cyclo-ligase [Acidimicrobiales bacterium]